MEKVFLSLKLQWWRVFVHFSLRACQLVSSIQLETRIIAQLDVLPGWLRCCCCCFLFGINIRSVTVFDRTMTFDLCHCECSECSECSEYTLWVYVSLKNSCYKRVLLMIYWCIYLFYRWNYFLSWRNSLFVCSLFRNIVLLPAVWVDCSQQIRFCCGSE